MTLIMAAALVLLSVGMVAADTVVLDLATCLELARGHAPRLQESVATESQAEAAMHEARARALPVVGLGSTYRYTSEVMEQTLGTPPATRTLRFGDGHAADLTFGVAAPLWTGGELQRQGLAAAAGLRAAEHHTEALRLDLVRDVRLAWYAVLGRQAQLEAARLAVERLQRHVDELAAAAGTGSATEEARLRAQVRLREAQQRQVQAAAALESSGIALGQLVGRPQTVVLPAGDLQVSLLEGSDLAPPRQQDRPDLAALAAEVERQEWLVRAAQGRLRPRVSGDVRAHYGRPGVDLLTNGWTPYATAALTVDWPVWDAGARRDQILQAEARARQARARRVELAEALAAAHQTAQVELSAALTALTMACEREELQGRVCQLVRGRLVEGAASESEYLDAEDDLAAAQVDLTVAQARVRQVEVALLWVLGH